MMESSAGSQDAKRRRIDSTPAFPQTMTIRLADNTTVVFLRLRVEIISFATRRFRLLLQDPSASIRVHASATQALVDTLAVVGASADLDDDSAAAASDWLNSLLNSNTFFTSHPSLIFQVPSLPPLFFDLLCFSHHLLKAVRLCAILSPLLSSSSAVFLHRAIYRCCRHPCKHVRCGQ